MPKLFIIFLLCMFFLNTGFGQQPDIVRRGQPSQPLEVKRIIPGYVDFQDTLMCDTLFEMVAENGLPVSYLRKVKTGVCIEGKCRMIHIWLLWDVTGRYLGFEMPPGEFLSKTEHVPFTAAEYDKLHGLLGDSNSKLANFTLTDLVPRQLPGKVDAITSATLTDVLDNVVQGAVYTTFTLWHLVHGQAKREIEKLTIRKLSHDLVLGLLNSPLQEDQVWVLNHFPAALGNDYLVFQRLLSLIGGENIYLAERALNAMPLSMVSDEKTQQLLLNSFRKSGFIQKRLIIQKLARSTGLTDHTISELALSLPDMSGLLVVQTFDLFRKHEVTNEIVEKQAIMLLENENRFIAGKAYQYLSDIPAKNKSIDYALKKFEREK